LFEDSKDDAELILREIRRGGYKAKSARVETRYAMQKVLKQRCWDIIICKNTLPRFNAMKGIAVLKESGSDIPLIIVSDTTKRLPRQP
jgi:DNA-binding response OmpR family regulator